MPLSEEELRLLEQMERALVEEDPKFASTLRGTSLRRTARRRAILAGLVFLAGVAILMTGAIMRITPVGIVGFVVMLLSATVALTAWRGRHAPVSDDPPGEEGHPSRFRVIDGGRTKGRRRPSAAHGSFMERLEQRWRHRRERGF